MEVQLVCLFCHIHIAAALGLFALQDLPDGDSKEKLLKKWNGQKLVIDSEWNRLKTSVCLIDCPESTGTGCIGKKDDKLYLITCWHNFAKKRSDSAETILKLARESTLQFLYVEEEARPEMCLQASTLLQNKLPVGNEVCMQVQYMCESY